MSKPICYDLFCGLGGWSEGFLAEGYECIGFDIEAHDYGTGGYPGTLILRDIRSIHGSELKDAAVIVASPPCQAYSYRAMPWKRAKALPPPDNTLFNECFRIQREAIEAAGHHIPMIVENVRGAQKWVGRARWNYGSFYLWGDVPALMPITFRARKYDDSGWLPNGTLKSCNRMVPDGRKVAMNFHEHEKTGKPGRSFQSAAVGQMEATGLKRPGQTISAGFNNWPKDEAGAYVLPDGSTVGGIKQPGICGPRNNGKGDAWFQDGAAKHGSRSHARKAASAMIAKIPFPLSQHIARTYKLEQDE
jgi:hypothetical protein